MESKLTALFAIVLFISLTLIGLILYYFLDVSFSLESYFQYLILLTFAVILLGRPLIKIALNLIRVPYRQNQQHFHVPGEVLPESLETASKDPQTGKGKS